MTGKFKYLKTLKEYLKKDAELLHLSLSFTFQHDNKSKYLVHECPGSLVGSVLDY